MLAGLHIYKDTVRWWWWGEGGAYSPPLLPPNMANRAWLISNEYDEAMTTSFCRSKIVVGGMVLVSIRGRKQKVAMLNKYVNCIKHFFDLSRL